MIYIIIGESGEYDDYRAHPVAYANTKEQADQALATLLDITRNKDALLKAVRDVMSDSYKKRPTYPVSPEYLHLDYKNKESYDDYKVRLAAYYVSREYLDYRAKITALETTPEFKAWRDVIVSGVEKRKIIEARFKDLLAPGELDVGAVTYHIVEIHTVSDLLRSR